MLICAFLIAICCGAIFIPIAYILERKESKEEKEKIKEIIKSHNYTKIEYLELYIYCINIRNSFFDEPYSVFRSKKIEKWDTVLDRCMIENDQSYYIPNYNNLCTDLLNLLYEYNYSIKKINYGILNNDYENEEE